MRNATARKNLSTTEARNLRTLLLLSVFEPESIGRRIAQARHEASLTQEELADLVNVSTRSQQGYEAGAVIPYKHMQRYADVLKKPVEWLLHGTGEAASTPAEGPAAALAAVLAEVQSARVELAEIRAAVRQLAEQRPPAEPDEASDGQA